MIENKFSNCNFTLHISKCQNIIVWKKEHSRQQFITLPARLRKILFQKRNNFPKRTTSILTQRSNIVPQVMPQTLALKENSHVRISFRVSTLKRYVARWHTGLSTRAFLYHCPAYNSEWSPSLHSIHIGGSYRQSAFVIHWHGNH